MDGTGVSRFLRRLPALLFCVLLGVAAMVFSARILLPKALPGQLIKQTPFRQILSGGAAEIGGTPPRPTIGFRGQLQWETQQNYPFRVLLLEAANTYVRKTGWNIPLLGGAGPSSKYDAGNGFICDASWASRLDSQLANERLQMLMNELAARNTNTLFVMEPPRIPVENRSLSGVFDFSAERLAERVHFLEQAGIPVLDLGSTLSERTPIYFRTDHHMTVEAGLLAARALAEQLSTGFGFPIEKETLSDDSFDIRCLPDAFLGSYGKQVTLARCRPDAFPVVTAKPTYRFRMQIPSREIDIEGDGRILFDEQSFFHGASYRINQYAAYGFGNNDLLRIQNLSRPDGLRLLVLSDSFDNACIMFLANAVSEIVDVDLRYFKGTIDDVFETGSFDVVIVFRAVPSDKQLAAFCPSNSKLARNILP